MFNQWNISSVALPDYNESTFFTFLGQDTLYAYFNNILYVENLGEDLNNIKIYPTIVNNKLSIEINASKNSSINIELIDISGKLVQKLYNGEIKEKDIFKKEFKINDLSKGIYFIKLNSLNTNASFKIVKI